MTSLTVCRLSQLIIFLLAPVGFALVLCVAAVLMCFGWIGILFAKPVKTRQGYRIRWWWM